MVYSRIYERGIQGIVTCGLDRYSPLFQHATNPNEMLTSHLLLKFPLRTILVRNPLEDEETAQKQQRYSRRFGRLSVSRHPCVFFFWKGKRPPSPHHTDCELDSLIHSIH